MPHKRNPVLSENLTGLARLVRAAVVPALENVALWHERDISHSSVERVIAPGRHDRTGLRAGRLAGMMRAAGGLSRDGWRANLESLGGVVHSRRGAAGPDAGRDLTRGRLSPSCSATPWRHGKGWARRRAAVFAPTSKRIPRSVPGWRRTNWIGRWIRACTWVSSTGVHAGVWRTRPHEDVCTVVLLIRPGMPGRWCWRPIGMSSWPAAWDPPGPHWPDRPGVVAGRDRLAGGTWMGVNRHGVVRGGAEPAGQPRACRRQAKPGRAAAAQPGAPFGAAQAAAAIAALDAGGWRSFNLVVADRHGAIFIRGLGHGHPQADALAPGLHMVTAHDPDDPDSPRVARHWTLRPRTEPGNWRGWQAILADRTGEAGEQINVIPRGGFGTVCSSPAGAAPGGAPSGCSLRGRRTSALLARAPHRRHLTGRGGSARRCYIRPANPDRPAGKVNRL